MNEILLVTLDYFFIIFHTLFTLFNLFGWIFRRTRRWNLLTLALTAISWFVLGFFYGWGYCFCTDWHWQVRMARGIYDMPNSYIKFLVDLFTGLDADVRLVDICTAIGFFGALGASLTLNFRDWRRGG